MSHVRKLLAVTVLAGGSAVSPISVTDAMSASHGGPCGGASAPSHTVLAHMVGQHARRSMKVIAHFESDQSGLVTGELILGKGEKRIEVTNWCRMWVGGKNAEESDVVHVLGTSVDSLGREMYVQVDVRSSEGGRIRVRTRAKSQHDDDHQMSSAVEDEHGGWKSLTGEGWLPLSRFRVR